MLRGIFVQNRGLAWSMWVAAVYGGCPMWRVGMVAESSLTKLEWGVGYPYSEWSMSVTEDWLYMR